MIVVVVVVEKLRRIARKPLGVAAVGAGLLSASCRSFEGIVGYGLEV